MADWSELQHDLLVLIVNRLNFIEDYLNFGNVCKSWHSVATKDNFNSNLPKVPWLMLAEEEDDNTCRKFFSLYNGMILKKRIPEATGKLCMESMGWFIIVGKDDGEISLLHPFSGVQIQLPHQNTTAFYEMNKTTEPWNFIHRAVLSANPSHTSDYVLMVIEGCCQFLSFWRPGDLLWTRIRMVIEGRFQYLRFWRPRGLLWTMFRRSCDVVYFHGHFYVVDNFGNFLVCDVTGPEPAISHIVSAYGA